MAPNPINLQGLVMHAATVISEGRRDDAGFTAPTYLPAASAGKNKLDVRWGDSVWLGIKLESK